MKRPPLASVFAALCLAALPAAAQTPPPPPPPPPSVTPVAFRALRVVPSQATPLVRSAFERNRAHFAACAPMGTLGTVSLRMATDANGQIASSTVRGSTLPATERTIAGCVVTASRHMRFPGSVQGTLDIEVGVAFGAPPPPAPRPSRARRR